MLPNFLIIGSPKCGTTSLASTLVKHESIYIPPIKEIGFFHDDARWNQKTLEWYESFFKEEKPLIGEATPFYASSHAALERIKKTLPGVKLIYIIRNPIKRAISHYTFRHRAGLEKREFYQALKDEKEKPNNPKNYLLQEGEYNKHFLKIEELFSLDNVLLLSFERLINNQEDELRRVYSFLEIKNGPLQLDFENKASVPKYRLVHRFITFFIRKGSSLKEILKKIIGRERSILLFRKVNKLNSKEAQKAEIDEDTLSFLEKYFRAEIDSMETLLDTQYKN